MVFTFRVVPMFGIVFIYEIFFIFGAVLFSMLSPLILLTPNWNIWDGSWELPLSYFVKGDLIFYFSTSGRRSSWLAFGWSTGHNVGGHYFPQYYFSFSFFSVPPPIFLLHCLLFLYKKKVRSDQKTYLVQDLLVSVKL